MKKLKIKDIVMIALLTALYLVFYMVCGMLAMVFGPFGHAISPGICAIFTGSIMLFMARKIGKFGQYLIMQAICMVLFGIMGAGYIPWVITSMIGALFADLIASRSKDTPVLKVAIASGLFHVGQALGSIIPSWFFMEQYRQDWINRGQTPEAMDEMIKYTSGVMGFVSTVIVFILAIAGVYLGQLILKKHLEKKDVDTKAA